ncbi:LEAF RUST 10 DISEASE-RESISTANCE LOCUS RECEPTOR-LIKE PROTEIN KINASE-like 2.1 [Tasmannia lanceolata]|uniref:LEAF RUST 10 DISEASE-RESISTANCE LOCUS RECEPTOR-LIKE PROTEIN KINASE-like 2.1 n=1 Tax=Tasmannia lanceolata TaxID=3420 RepID=UPI004064C70A
MQRFFEKLKRRSRHWMAKKKDLLEKEEEQVLEIKTENLILDKGCPQAGNIVIEEDVIDENEFRSHHRCQQMQDFTQAMFNNQGQRAPPYRRKFLANKPIVFWRKKTKSTPWVDAFLENFGYLGQKRYKYLDIKTMTSSFRYKIGEGGCGTVFKGMLPDHSLIAVKVLKDSKDGENGFITEVASIGRASHANIIRLLGFCSEGPSRALVYEYLPNGSLDKFIYTRELSHIFGWKKLFEIAVGIARGLEYLHHACRINILHLDIKTSNILLDEDFFPRISDFGLAMLCVTRDINSLTISCPRGTWGYIAPEILWGRASDKADVFSYGIMLLEMASGRKAFKPVKSSARYLRDWIYKRLSQQEDIGLGDFECIEEEETAKKMILVGLWCSQKELMHRPSMSMVLEMLEGSFEGLQMPPNPSPP